jgi:hypothetical protein
LDRHLSHVSGRVLKRASQFECTRAAKVIRERIYKRANDDDSDEQEDERQNEDRAGCVAISI